MNFERGYTMGSIFFDLLAAGGISEAFLVLNEKISSFAEVIKLPALALFILGALIAAFVGTAGYKYIKLVAAACFAVAGYGLGGALFEVAKGHWNWDVPGFVSILAGLVVMALLGYLAYKKFAYSLFGVACFTGFVLAYFVYPNYVLALAVGVIAAMVSMYFVRYAFVTITSFVSGFTFISMLSAIAPQIGMLKLHEGFMGKFLAVVISLAFVALQFYITRGHANGGVSNKIGGIVGEVFKKHGTKRVKIRRVFDMW